jgi:hypothetical protein
MPKLKLSSDIVAQSCCSKFGVFDRIFAAFLSRRPRPERITFESTHLKASRNHRALGPR